MADTSFICDTTCSTISAEQQLEPQLTGDVVGVVDLYTKVYADILDYSHRRGLAKQGQKSSRLTNQHQQFTLSF